LNKKKDTQNHVNVSTNWVSVSHK